MRSIFSSKHSLLSKEMPKSNLDNFKQDENVKLEVSEMTDVKGGGKQPAKTFSSIFSWNSSCGGVVPQ